MEKSSIKIISNITLKSSYEQDPLAYLPYDLLPTVYRDVRMKNSLTSYQRKQALKGHFFAKRIVDEDD